MIELQNWIEFTKQYPPAEIFFGSNKEKQERRCKTLCEQLFTFEPTDTDHPASVLRKMWSSWRDLEVLMKLGTHEMKPEVVKAYADEFIAAAKAAIRELEKVYKPDQLLWNYYTPKSMRINMVSSLVYAEIKVKL